MDQKIFCRQRTTPQVEPPLEEGCSGRVLCLGADGNPQPRRGGEGTQDLKNEWDIFSGAFKALLRSLSSNGQDLPDRGDYARKTFELLQVSVKNVVKAIEVLEPYHNPGVVLAPVDDLSQYLEGVAAAWRSEVDIDLRIDLNGKVVALPK